MWKIIPDEQLVEESGRLVKVIAKHGKLTKQLLKQFWSLTNSSQGSGIEKGVVEKAFIILYKQDNLTEELLEYMTTEINNLIDPKYSDKLLKQHFTLLATNPQFRENDVSGSNIRAKVVNIFWRVIFNQSSLDSSE